MRSAATAALSPPAPPTRRLFVWRLAGLAAVLVALLWGAGALGIRWLAERRWTAMKSRWQALREEARARGLNRPPLRGAALEGNAWDDYTPALQEVRTLYDLESQAAPRYLKEGSPAQRGLVLKVLDRHPLLLESIRRGAQRMNVNLALEWKEGALALPGRHGSATLAALAVCQARFLVDAGRSGEAVELLLDTCRVAGDLDHPEDMVLEFEELAELVQSGRLSRAELEGLGRELELLDRGFPRRGHRMALDFLSFGSLCLKSGGSITLQIVAYGADPDAALWRFGYSGRLMKADAFDTIGRAVQQLSDADERPWTESRELLQAISRDLASSGNPITQAAPDDLLGSDLPHRGHRAQLRLLRVATHYRATGEVLDLEDPFGARLLTRRDGDTLRVWSVGAEGLDHGGTGAFGFDREGKDAQDIVLEIRR
jgi:hypothetical protein